ncbi:hypothetical protein, partial [Poseidonibacter sp.]|uniref:hypothetical protein n=1 Tax=Poseidonibacter sp. TaxID=2321188 RepID=UPI003C73B3E9
MERRDRSLKALSDLQYINELNEDLRAESLKSWVEDNLSKNKIDDFDLEIDDLNKLAELFYRNIAFLKSHRKNMKHQIQN